MVNPAQARKLLAAVTYVGRYRGRGRRMRALYACLLGGDHTDAGMLTVTVAVS